MKTQKINELLKDYEKDMLNDWHKAMGDKKISFKDSIKYIGGCAELVCRSLYLRENKLEASKSITFNDIVEKFHTEKIMDDLIVFHMNTVRKPRNIATHLSRKYSKAFVDLMRNHLKQIMIWYKAHTGAKLYGLNLDKYKERLRKRPVTTVFNNFNKKETINETVYEDVIKNERIMTLEPEEKMITDTPVYSCLVIDESGSMIDQRDKVIESHSEALSAIRGSMICKNEALFLMQYTFNFQNNLLNALSNVESNANDKIISLNSNNYKPFGRTALYDTLYEAITTLQIEVNSFKNNRHKTPKITIAILTDGVDNLSSKSAEDVRMLMSDLYEKRAIQSSVVIGWEETSDNQLETIKEKIGFQKYISLKKSDPSAIRDAFQLWSQLTIS